MSEAKKKARRILRGRLKRMTDAQIFQQSYAACLKLCDTESWLQAQTVMLYLAMPREADPLVAMIEGLRMNKTVCVPRIVNESRSLEAVRLETLNCKMTVDDYGIREPVGATVTDLADLDLIIVPGLGFSEEGRRLGRGGGFYDKLLSRSECKPIRCGFGFNQQILVDLPVEDHDQPLDLLVTDRQVFRFNR
ncbi:MAG: 5-formyltetrahydrofolate cyclo-ligase [Acidobacteriota bacterium]|nr:5-formyltetrahydrofolate cyclo-ligase [Acidobacteriota bacterium]